MKSMINILEKDHLIKKLNRIQTIFSKIDNPNSLGKLKFNSKKAKRHYFCFLLFIIISSNSLFGTDFYMSNLGNDANTGTSAATAWKTLAKLSTELGGPSGTWSITITAGDRIFFRRGDTFRGEIYFSAWNNSGITFDAYGSGAEPAIKGSEIITGWTVHSGNIWKASVTTPVHMLFQGGTSQQLARHPNFGVFNTTAATGTSATSPSTGSSGLNFVGANICVREYEWRNNRQRVTGQIGNTVSWTASINAANNGSYIYFDNKLNLLDVPGEWYYEPSNQTLYLMTSGVSPNDLLVEATTHLTGIVGNDNRSNNVFRHLKFMHYADHGIRLMGSSNNNIIEECLFEKNLQGVFLSGNQNSIESNTFNESYLQAIVAANSANTSISRNTIQSTGMTWGKHRPGFSGEFYPNAIYQINGKPGCIIAENIINYSGYNGIKFIGDGIIVEKNKVSYSLMNMSDGGAIYTWGAISFNCIVRNNFIDNVLGDYQGLSPNGIALGIYIDNLAYNIQVLNNTVTDIPKGEGIVINAGAYNCTIQNNTVYKCNVALSFADWIPGHSIYGNVSNNNVLYANVPGGIPLQIASDDNNYNTMAISDQNYLHNVYDTKVARYIWSAPQTFTHSQWKIATGLDLNSKTSFFNWTFPVDNSYILKNFTNSSSLVSLLATVNLDNIPISSILIPPYSSVVLVKSIALPVELIDFVGQGVGQEHLLKWETSSEINSKHFEVQRLESDQFRTLVTVPAKGFASAYNTRVVVGSIGNKSDRMHYYRLQIVDLDGSITYSKVISIDAEPFRQVYVYPNPVSEVLYVRSDFTETAEIFNVFGQIVQTAILNQPLQRLDISTLPSGLYWVKGTTFSTKFLKL